MTDLENFVSMLGDKEYDESEQENGQIWVEVYSDNDSYDSLLFIFEDGNLVEIE